MGTSIIKRAREKAGISQEELAIRTQKSQAQISRFEQPNFDLSKISAGDLIKISEALGIDLNDLIKESWQESTFKKDWGAPYEKYVKDIEGIIKHLKDKPDFQEEAIEKSIEEFITVIKDQKKLPICLVRGQFDAGKSYLINKLIAEDIIPNKYQPETGATIYIVHEDLRPAGISGKVNIISSIKLESDKNQERFKIREFLTGNFDKEFEITTGGLELLKDASIKKGSYRNIEVAVIYSDASILNTAILCDTPGTGGETGLYEDDQKDFEKIYRASVDYDSLIYLSSANGFLNDEDIEHLKHLVGQLNLYPATNTSETPLGNVIIAMSHATQSLPEEEIFDIKKHSSERLLGRLGELIEIRRIEEFTETKLTKKHIEDRIVPFWFQIDSRRLALENKIDEMLCRKLPEGIQSDAAKTLSAFKSNTIEGIKKYINYYQNLLKEKDKKLQLLDELQKNEPARKREVEYSRKLIQSKIDTHLAKTEAEWETIYNKYVNEDKIESIIKEKFENKSTAKKATAGYLNDIMQDELKEKLKNESEIFAAEVNEFIEHYENPSFFENSSFNKADIKINFDAYGAFASGLAGAGTLGALSIWAATLGNLGPYIISAKAFSVLTSLGLSGGISAAAFSALIAAIGGPITLFIGLSTITASIAWAIMGQSWQKRLAKKIVQILKKKNYKEVTKEEAIQNFWNQTRQNFEKAADHLEKEYQQAILELKNKLQNYNAEEIEQTIKDFENFLNFIKGTPHIERT